MKRFFALTVLLVCMAALVTERAHARQPLNIDEAIRNVVQGITPRLERGASIAVMPIEASSGGMSDRLTNGMMGGFLNFGFTVVARERLEVIEHELRRERSARFDPATTAALGHGVGAQVFVFGEFQRLGDNYRFSGEVIEARRAVTLGTFDITVRNDNVVASLLGVTGRPTFTGGQRWGTWCLNLVVPGLGSFLVMGDALGGTIQLVSGGAGWALLVVGFMNLDQWVVEWRTEWDPVWGQHVQVEGGHWEQNNPLGIGLMVAGGALLVGQQVFNIIRSSRHNPRPRIASTFNPEAWNIALVPGQHGIERFSVSHTLRF